MALNIQVMAVTPFRQNCTLMWDDVSGEAVITDLGGDVAFVREQVAERNLRVKEIWLTHGHLDHAGGVPFWLQHEPTPVLGPHQDDEFLLQSLPETTANYGWTPSPAFVPTRYLNEGEQLNVGAYRFDVLHIPGHTPGHVVFYCASEKVLIAGDILFYESIGRTDFPRGNHEDLLCNIRQKLYTLPEDTHVLPGHGRTTTIGHEKYNNPFVRV
ncbi:MBL fold metallo-hydrolase [Neisseriaceae bacterium B1]